MGWNSRLFVEQTWMYPLSIIVLTTLLFLLIVFSFRNDAVPQIDRVILGWFHAIHKPYLNHFFASITWLGSLWILLPLYLATTFALAPYIMNIEKILGIIFWGTIATTYFFKYEFERKRPFLFGPINELPIDPSFPSAHTAQISAFALGIWLSLYPSGLVNKELLGAALLLIVFFVGASRMYLQVHFPTDVFAGILIALFWSAVAMWMIKPGGIG